MAAILVFVPTLQGATLIQTNATWRLFKGRSEASSPDLTAWRTTNFNDTAFSDAPAPFWYGDVCPGGTQLTDMLNSYSCLFLRRGFVVTNVAEVGALRLGAFVDDGFVAWINGTEVRRINMPDPENTPVYYTNLARNATEPVPFVEYLLDEPWRYLNQGANVLAVQVFNTSLGSSDLGFDANLASILRETNPPVIAAISPAPGQVTALTQATVTFSEPVTGVTADSLLVNGWSASAVSGGGNIYTFQFAQPVYGPVYCSWATNQNITDLASPPNAFDAQSPAARWEYWLEDIAVPAVVSLFPAAGATLRRLGQIEAVFSENVAGVEAADLLINGQAATNMLAETGNRFVFQFPSPATGMVLVAWATNHGIFDLATPPNPFGGGAWNYVLDPLAPTPDLVITEIMAANQTGAEDEDIDPTTGHGEVQDWIELCNRGSNAVDLAGWALSDDPAAPGQWIFPARLLGPGQYLVVFASGKDRRAPTGTNWFHTHFKLSRAGEFLGLFSPDSPRELVSGFTPQFPAQRNDHSYGYDTAGQTRYFATPTPGRPNGSSTIAGVAAAVHFSVSRGFFTQPFQLYLTTATPGATIRYTTNGAAPTVANSLVYQGPLTISGTTLLRAAAFRANFLPSAVETHTYLFNQGAAVLSLPVLSLVTDQDNLTGPKGIIGISNVVQQADGSYVPADTNGYHNPSKHGLAWERPVSAELLRAADPSGFQIDCGIRVQGSDYQRPRTTAASKFSFRLYFRGDYGPGKLEYPLFPLTPLRSFDQIVLRAGFNDPDNPFIRDELTRRLSHDQGQVAAHGTFVNLFINGVYKGYYNPAERVNGDFARSYQGGSAAWDMVSPPWAIGAGAPGVVDGDRNAFVSLVNYVSQQNVLLPSVYQEIGRRFDLVNFVDYLLLNVYTGMGDWPQNNFRAGRDRGPGGIFRFYVWDGEWGFGIYGRVVTRDTFAENGPGPNDCGLATSCEIGTLYQRLRPSPEFRLLFADRIHKHFFNGGALMDTNIVRRAEEMRDQLRGVLPSMDAGIVSTWVPQRRGIIMGHFVNYGLYGSDTAPGFSQWGGNVPRGFSLGMTNIGGALYYTTNGADPRTMFTGAVAPTAAAYSQPVVLNQSARVRARALQGTNWSALVEADFQVASLGLPLRLTEINYHPPDGSAYEFLELYNAGAAPLDLSRMTFEGIDFQFPDGAQIGPGATLVLASAADTNAFAARYPRAPIRYTFGGQLNNAGERLALRDRQGQTVFTVDYSDRNGWPTGADGGGSSLEIVDPLGDPEAPANWRASAVRDGTPGLLSPAPTPGPVMLNELMAANHGAVSHGNTFPAWLELWNNGPAEVALANWSLGDQDNPRRFIFPAEVRLPAGGYLVVWCDAATNMTPGWHTDFTLNPAGGTVLLQDASTALVDVVTFGLQPADYSLGRLTNGWQLNWPTPGSNNVGVAVGSATNLVINEWLANARPGEPDWLELYNRSVALPVSLAGLYLQSPNGLHQLNTPAFLAPGGFVTLWADEGVGPDHLDFKLPAAGGTLVLYDALAMEINRVNYGAQLEGVSVGRLPDGSGNVTAFPGSASPGAANYVVSYTGPWLNEVLARNVSAVTNAAWRTADYLELYNPNPTNVDLAGMSLSVDAMEPGQWVFPANTIIPARGYVVVWCDAGQPPSTAAGLYLNNGRDLNGDSGEVHLFNSVGQVVDSVVYGFQVNNLPLGRVGASWRLLIAATPGATNAAAAALGSASAVRINEWMANPVAGEDWFELFNPGSAPVDLGQLYLTDDLSNQGQTNFMVAPLSFIGARQWVKFVADSQPERGRHHVNFALDAGGDSLRLCQANLTLIDSVYFGRQRPGISHGRFPDGQTAIVTFDGAASPGEANYRLLTNVVINEIMPAAPSPCEAAIELFNAGDHPASIGGWFLSDRQDNFCKYRLPQGLNLLPGQYYVVYENAFNTGATNGFALSGAVGGELWLSEADTAGNLTGFRAGVKYGPVLPGVSLGPVATSVGTEFVALGRHTFGVDAPATVEQFRTGAGSPNAPVLVGPVVISEIMAHPAPSAVSANNDEYIELHNLGANPVPLFDPAFPTNGWRLVEAVDFVFPADATLPAGGYGLVVNFDPAANRPALEAFQARYGVATNVPLFGPFQGKLDNAGEDLKLAQPAPPPSPPVSPADYVPWVLADHVDYRAAVPWPAEAINGSGLSLQRRNLAAYGNEPTNWVASLPTPGAANGAGVVLPPVITQPPHDQATVVDASLNWPVVATGGEPLAYQWRYQGVPLPEATNATLALAFLQLEDSGQYDVLVSNPAGSALSPPARLVVSLPPEIVSPPQSQNVKLGSNVTFSVQARGSGVLAYQWRYQGVPIANATNSSLALTNVQLEQEGEYEVVVSTSVGTVSARAALVVLIAPVVLQAPLSQSVVAGGDVSLSVLITGHPAPFNYFWRRLTPRYWTITNLYSDACSNFITFNTTEHGFLLTNNVLASNFNCRLVISNASVPGVGIPLTFTITVLADTDGDGLPNVWETAYGLDPASPEDGWLDADGDGMNNRAEYLAGANPTNAASGLKANLTCLPGAAVLQFEAVSNKTYSIQFTDGLANGPWLKLGDVIARTNNRLESLADPAWQPRRFYRLVSPFAP